MRRAPFLVTAAILVWIAAVTLHPPEGDTPTSDGGVRPVEAEQREDAQLLPRERAAADGHPDALDPSDLQEIEAEAAGVREGGLDQDPAAATREPLDQVIGFVHDGQGRAVQGLTVDLRRGARIQGELGSGGPGGNPFGSQDFFFEGERRVEGTAPQRTGVRGEFAFEGVAPVEGFVLVVAGGKLSDSLEFEVDPALEEQRIELPGTSELAGSIEVDLWDPEGQPLVVNRVRSRLQRLAAPHPVTWAVHDPGLSFSRGAGWTLTGLAPGVWQVWAFAEGGGVALLSGTVEPGKVTQLSAILPRRTFIPRLTQALEAGAQEELTPDELSGFADFPVKGQERRGLGQGGTDRNFRHTFHFAPGGIRGALLELELEAAGWADNDSLTLEYLPLEDGQHRWAWGGRIRSLPGAPSNWQQGARAHLQLDLSALPGGAAPFDLRSYLQDGRLDIYVQDDTIVHGVRLLLDP